MESRKTVLICDDEPALRELIRASLDDGYLFAEAGDGIAALDLAARGQSGRGDPRPDAASAERPRGPCAAERRRAAARRSGDRDHCVERDARGRSRCRGGRLRDEAVRAGSPAQGGSRRNRTMSRPPVSLQTRLIAASAVLAVLVIGVFVAMMLARLGRADGDERGSAVEERDHLGPPAGEARPRPRDRHPRLCLHGQDRVPHSRTRRRGRSCVQAKRDLFLATERRAEPAQAGHAQINQLIDEYIGCLRRQRARHRAGEPRAPREISSVKKERSGSESSSSRFAKFIEDENDLAESHKQSADTKSRHAIELGVAGLDRLDDPDSSLRPLPVTVDRAARPGGRRRGEPARGGRPLAPTE